MVKDKRIKIVTIGGGSSYTPELAEGFIKRYKDIPITEWWLVDIDEGKEKLDIVYNLIKRMIKKSGLDIKLFQTLDRREAIKDADFITTQLRVGRLEAREKDEYIPLKNGFVGQETNGAGGMFKALRTIPVILDIVKDVQELAKPTAWLINFTNPAGLVTEAVNKLTDYKRFIGVCNVPITNKMDVAGLLDTTIDHIQMDVAGLNHLSCFTKFYKDRVDYTDKIIELVSNPEVSKKFSMNNIAEIPWNTNFIKDLKAIPNPYYRYYYKTRDILEEYEELAKTMKVRATVVRELEKSLFEKYKDESLDVKPKELEERGGAYYSDVAAGIIKALYKNTNAEFAVNVRNDNKIKNLPADWVVEVTTKVGKKGALKVNRDIFLPEQIKGLVHLIKNYELGVVEAVKQKKLELAYLPLISNPLANDDEAGRTMFLELIKAHKKYLGYYTDLDVLLNEPVNKKK